MFSALYWVCVVCLACVDEGGGGGGSAIFRLFLEPLKRVIRESGWFIAVHCNVVEHLVGR